MILRASRPPATNSAPAPRPNSVAGSKPPVAGSALGGGAPPALASALPALASGSPALASALPALASALGPAAEDCSIVCVHSPVVEGSVVIELPEKSRSSALDSYWTTPCSLATCPVWPTCWPLGHRLALLPLLLTENEGEDLPLVMRLSDSSCETCAKAGAAAITIIASTAPNSINFFIVTPSMVSFADRQVLLHSQPS